jgi:hypothetical protein
VASDIDPFSGVSPTLSHESPSDSPDPFSGVSTPHGENFVSSPMPQAQDTSWLRYPRLMKQELIGGAKDVINLPGQLTKLGEQYLPNIMTRPIGSIDWSNPFSEPDVPVASNPFPAISNERSPDLIPQGGEKYAAGALRGIGGAALTMGVGGAASLASRSAAGLAPTASDIGLLGWQSGKSLLTQGAAPGAAASALDQILPESTDPRIKLALNLIVGGATAIGAHALLSGDPIGNVASIMGKSQDAQTSGEAMQSEIRDWKNGVDANGKPVPGSFPEKMAALSAPLDAKMASDPPVTLGDYSRTLNDIANKGGPAKATIDLLSSKLPANLLAELQKMTGGGPSSLVSIPWSNARQLRSAIGELMANPKLMKDTNPAVISDLYRAVNNDLGPVAEANGAGAEWKAYNEGSSRMYSIAQNTLSKIVSDPNTVYDKIKPEDAANKFWNAGAKGATDLVNLRSEVPGAADELAAGLLRSSPEKWANLPDASKAALIPSPYARDVVENAMPKIEKSSVLPHIGGAFLGAEAAESLGHVAAHLLGMTDIDPMVSRLIGMAAPMLYRGTKNIVQHPSQLSVPAQGSLGGLVGGGPL